MRKKILFGIFLIAVVVVVIAACEQEGPLQNPFVVESASSPSSPISVKLTMAAFSEPPKLGSETDLTVDVSVHPSYDRILPNATVKIDLPEGLSLINGDTQWTGGLTNENHATLNARVKFVKAGNWSLSASAKSYFAKDAWYSGNAEICFSVSPDKISQKSGKCLTQVTLPPRVEETKPSQDECTTDSDCGIGGCSGQICATKEKAMNIITTCEYLPVYGCYKLTSCGCVQEKCQWVENSEFNACKEQYS